MWSVECASWLMEPIRLDQDQGAIQLDRAVVMSTIIGIIGIPCFCGSNMDMLREIPTQDNSHLEIHGGYCARDVMSSRILVDDGGRIRLVFN